MKPITREMMKMNNIKELRIAKGYTRGKLAKESGVSLETIKRLEDGLLLVDNCKLKTLVGIARGLGCKVVDLLPKKSIRYMC